MISWAAGMHWSYGARAWFGLFATLTDGRVLLRHEVTWLHVDPEDAVADLKDKLSEFGIAIPREAPKLHLPPLRYVVAQRDIFPAAKGTGETISETFGRAGIPMRPADMDEINGWNRLRSWLREREHTDTSENPPKVFRGPSLIVHPDCEFFISAVQSICEDDKNPDVTMNTTDVYPANGTRYWAMSRPSPSRPAPKAPPPPGSVYYDIQKIRRLNDRPVLGSDNVI